MAWTAPRTWVSGELVTALMMNTHVRDNMNFLRSTAQLSQTFRGLIVRTHEDGDVEKKSVQMIQCDELITDFGTRVNPRRNLTADVTASGASGLDTGSEGASRWYSIWYIFKGPTAGSPDTPAGPTADAIILHRAKDYLQDAAQTASAATAEKLRQGATDRVKLAQGFKVGTVGPIEFVDVYLNKVASPTGQIWFTIEGDSSGSPNGTPVATSNKVDTAALTTTTAVIRFIFRVPFTPASTSTQYHLVLQGNYTASAVNYAQWLGDSSNSYANGSAKKFDGTNWAAATPLDFAFKQFTTENDTALTLPSGYTEKCLIGYVRNDAGSDFYPMYARDRIISGVGATSPSLVLNGITTTIPNVVDVSTWVPPSYTGGIVQFELYNANAAAAWEIAAGTAYGANDLGSLNIWGFYWEEQVAGRFNDAYTLIPCEYQHIYAWVTSGTGNLYIIKTCW